mmetsp:Transcript_1399/g.1977  ORF Transcript_1399/g.1977 Transcript_1399/m.1977 type:complete len:194 (+) Transcript_1399:58-639(+)
MSIARKTTLIFAVSALLLAFVAFTASRSSSSDLNQLGAPLARQSVMTRGLSRMATRNMDLRQSMSQSFGKKCTKVNDLAHVCGKMVVLRSPTAVHADKKVNTDAIMADVSSALEDIEFSPQLAIYAGGAVLAVLIGNGVVTTIDAIPVLPYFMKLVGTGYSAWFLYRYLLFDDARKELLEDIDAIKTKITGSK